MFYDDPDLIASAEAYTRAAEEHRHAMRAAARERIRQFQADLREQGVEIQAGIEQKFYGRTGKNACHMDPEMIAELLQPVATFERAAKNVPVDDCKWPSLRELHHDEDGTESVGAIVKVGTLMLSGVVLANRGMIVDSIVQTLMTAGGVTFAVDFVGRHYEATFTNKKGSEFGALDALADDVEAARATLAANAQQLGVESIEFTGRRYRQTLGRLAAPDMHFNISAWKNDENLMQDGEALESCRVSMLQAQKETALLRFDSATKHRNIKEGVYNPAYIGVRSAQNTGRDVGNFFRGKGGASLKHRGNRMEDRLLLGDSDPLLSAAVNIGAVYEGLVRAGVIENRLLANAPHAPDTTNAPLPSGFEDSRRAFSESDWNRNVLGAAFCKAVDRYYTFLDEQAIIQPPGKNPFDEGRG